MKRKLLSVVVSSPRTFQIGEMIQLADNVLFEAPSTLVRNQLNVWKFSNPQTKFVIFCEIRNAFDKIVIYRGQMIPESDNEQTCYRQVYIGKDFSNTNLNTKYRI